MLAGGLLTSPGPWSAFTPVLAQASSMQVVLGLERELLDAATHRDAATIERLLADDIVATGPRGKVLGKTELIARWTKADPSVTDEASTIDEVSVRDFGTTVIVHARVTDSARERGVLQRSVTRVTDVWVKRGTAWQLVALHESLLPAPQP